jgi:hypothetical protein
MHMLRISDQGPCVRVWVYTCPVPLVPVLLASNKLPANLLVSMGCMGTQFEWCASITTYHACMQVPVVTATEAAKLLQEQPEQYVLVDVRNSEEQQVCRTELIVQCRWSCICKTWHHAGTDVTAHLTACLCLAYVSPLRDM